MPVVLRIEKATPPERTPLLEAAAAAALAVCLDPRAADEGEWHQEVATWISGRIRKVTRRARGAHWEAVQALPGVTIRVGGAEARALVPCRVVDTPREVARLQITGSDLLADSPGPAPLGVPVLWLNPEVPMSTGKAAAQVGHATMLLAAMLSPSQLAAWAADDFRCAVRTPEPAEWKLLLPGDDPSEAWLRHQAVAVRDAGFTEVAPGTITVLSRLVPRSEEEHPGRLDLRQIESQRIGRLKGRCSAD
jgi:peptidyl-tRNA hydrolase